MEKARLTASERESLIRLNVALEIMAAEPEHLRMRTAMVPYAKRDFAMMAAKIRKLMAAFAEKIPDEQIMTYYRALHMASYTVGIKKPGTANRNENDYGMWFSYKVINALLAGCHDHCMMCNLDKVGRKRCALRNALTIIPNDVPDRDDNDCPYYGFI